MTTQPGALVAGRYRLTDIVGQGGMGRVWRGHDQVLDRDVALKELLLPPGISEQERSTLVQRTSREARAAGRVNHPGVITIHDVVEHDGAPWIVMELINGQSLGALIKDSGALPWQRVAEIGAKIADALGHAHASGIVHRDMKPDNVLLAGDRVVVTDFGIAQIADGGTRLTMAGTVVGTPHYMAPEQLQGLDAGPLADMWSLGASLYAAVEGNLPFDGPNVTSVVSGILTGNPPPPVRAGGLEPVLGRLLQKDPRYRPAAVEVARTLTESLRGPAPAWPAGPIAWTGGPVAGGTPAPFTPAPGAQGYPAPSALGYPAPGVPGYPGPGGPGYPAPAGPGYPPPGAQGYPGPGAPGYLTPGAPGYPAPTPAPAGYVQPATSASPMGEHATQTVLPGVLTPPAGPMPPSGPAWPGGFQQPAQPPPSGGRSGRAPLIIGIAAVAAVAIALGAYFGLSSGSSGSPTADGTTGTNGATAPAASASASAPASPAAPPPVGDACLVGTWKDGGYASSTTYNGTQVPMKGAGGNLDHIAASGTDQDTYDGSDASALFGTYQGKQLKESYKGTALSTIHANPKAHTATSLSRGWTADSTRTYTYGGETQPGTLGKATGVPVSYTYTCTPTTLTWTSDGQLVDTETRVSATP